MASIATPILQRCECNMGYSDCLEISHAVRAVLSFACSAAGGAAFPAGLLDTSLLCLYKHLMRNYARVILPTFLQFVLVACVTLAPPLSGPAAPTGSAAATTQIEPRSGPPPTPTPEPIVRVASGDRLLFNGDYEGAIQDYLTAAVTDDPAIRAAALWGLARSQYADKRFDAALETLTRLEAEVPDSGYSAPAQFLKGQCLAAVDRHTEAAEAYANYIIARPGALDSYVSELRGDALTAAGDFAGAVDAYQSAQAAPHLDDAQALQIKIAQGEASLGNTEKALELYDLISASTANDYVRAQMDYLAGQALVSLGQIDQAHDRYRHTVENYPAASFSYLALVELLGDGVQVSDLDRGLTDFYAGVYDKALEALNRYIAQNPGEDGTAHYYRAASLDHLALYQEAVDAYSVFLKSYSSHPKWADGWFEKSIIEWFNLNRYPEGAQTLLDFVRVAPAAPEAPDALFAAARILEQDGRFDDAALHWQRVGDEYPTHEMASTALLFAGIMQYRQTDYAASLPLFDRSLILASMTEDQARAQLWIGKARDKLGRRAEAENAWQLAQSADPGGYYSERASDLLNDRGPFAPPPITNLEFDLAAERKAADAWVRLKFTLAPETELGGLDTLESDPRLIRGRELWNLGLYDRARLEFEDLRLSVSTDPILTYRLANYLLELGLYRSGITAARQVLALAGLEDQQASLQAPPYFSHIRYGLYYSDLIFPAAEENGLDPLFLFSVVRQESLFEGFVSSTAGARGLMQIVPDTGASISQQLGWPITFDPDDLYRPNVSVAYGAHYLSTNRRMLNDDLYAALAAYNGGPGNAAAWQDLAQGDPDLFLETVRAQETRDYIRRIYEIYAIYRRLYGPGIG